MSSASPMVGRMMTTSCSERVCETKRQKMEAGEYLLVLIENPRKNNGISGGEELKLTLRKEAPVTVATKAMHRAFEKGRDGRSSSLSLSVSLAVTPFSAASETAAVPSRPISTASAVRPPDPGRERDFSSGTGDTCPGVRPWPPAFSSFGFDAIAKTQQLTWLTRKKYQARKRGKNVETPSDPDFYNPAAEPPRSHIPHSSRADQRHCSPTSCRR
jgi:hypothetical protein